MTEQQTSPETTDDNLSERIYAAISDAYYDARDGGGTMTTAAHTATAAVEKLLEERDPQPRQVSTHLRNRLTAAVDHAQRAHTGPLAVTNTIVDAIVGVLTQETDR